MAPPRGGRQPCLPTGRRLGAAFFGACFLGAAFFGAGFSFFLMGVILWKLMGMPLSAN
ncbi:hypothetical protein SAVERM_4054 [Streptomyces avermitilis MA-4680 = NBRC 14893]|uniref:Uncharacterized protein n=1 Tax=Streptomyces avermitilis (strain ATCC 31267 / DSM 46492 / JCM 5070 / NBRC 14893 / NCIMB 12804 / NRRL 8165 / MA-4680) TaxID=227882 RepID=Q82G44_STRAW|nr:hypothetical protein SAVERM_4054 [Streptomyces avermitilis MA-4680 = NBRC 14893]